MPWRGRSPLMQLLRRNVQLRSEKLVARQSHCKGPNNQSVCQPGQFAAGVGAFALGVLVRAW